MRGLRSSCGWLLAAAALAQAPPEPTHLEGFVAHSITGVPILRAHVALRGSGADPKVYGALTTAEGKFSITGIIPGIYQASVDRPGFFMPAAPDERATVEVTVMAGERKEPLTFRLAPLGSISGRVLDAEGEPVEGAEVTLVRGPGSYSTRSITDDTGRFRLDGLRPGKYRVKAALPFALPTPPEIRTDGTVEARYEPTYHPGVTDYKSAALIKVTTGAEVNEVQIRQVRAPTTRISGRVVGIAPEAPDAMLMFSQTTGPGSIRGVKKDGTFDVWNVDQGKYLLTARWYIGDRSFQTAPVDIDVGQSNIKDIELRLVPPSDISGEVTFDDEQARPKPALQDKQAQPGSVRAPRLGLKTVDTGMFAEPDFSDVAADGTFFLKGVEAAKFRVALSWTSAYVKAVTLGSDRVDGNILNLRSGAGGASLTVLVSSAFGSISGRVSDGDGPAAGARIALVRDDFMSRDDATFAYTDNTGAYTIGNVRPGKYRIAAVEEYDHAPFAGNLDDYEDILARIEVQAKDKLTKDLKRHPPVK